MTGTAKTTEPRRQWSVRSFEAFWSSPEPSRVPASLTEDIVGHWAGREEPARGRAEYTGCIAALVDALPDVRLSVAEHAQSGEFTFIRWIMRATGAHGPFEISGIDRVRVRDGRVAENFVVVDTAAFEERSGRPVPWA